MKQVFNPFLPLDEYIPDGEPHVFGDRVYHYGSHDQEGGHTFCMNDYVTYSAPVSDLADWRYEGVIYSAKQDPDYPAKQYMYAPDVVCGNDGKYYLYYAMSGEYGVGGYTGTIHVAVCDEPAGHFEYLGEVKYPDGTPMWEYVCFDPAVINDNGTIRMYYGTQYDFEERDDFGARPELLQQEVDMFGRTADEILAYRERPESCEDVTGGAPDSIMGAIGLELEDDMLTVKSAPKHIIPYKVKGTSFEEHPFFEAASMRKVGEKYYFIYSSMQNHELCYATSVYPDHGFTFGGTIVSNGDIGIGDITAANKHNMTGTTHGSIVEVNGQWYVFYHRLTHKSDYSRQACAEKITIEPDGTIKQVELTSCGLNSGPLEAGKYPAVIACIITNGSMPHGSNSIYQYSFPNVTHLDDERFIGEIENNTLIGFKYFNYQSVKAVKLTARVETPDNKPVYDGPVRVDVRCEEFQAREELDDFAGAFEGAFEVRTEENGPVVCEIALDDFAQWRQYESVASIPDGVHGLFLTYQGTHHVQLLSVELVAER